MLTQCNLEARCVAIHDDSILLVLQFRVATAPHASWCFPVLKRKNVPKIKPLFYLLSAPCRSLFSSSVFRELGNAVSLDIGEKCFCK